MTQQGAALQSYNNELVKCIEELCAKRDELSRQIRQEEEEKGKLQGDLRVLTERLARINETLAHKMATRNEFDKTIAETEAAYMKVRRPPLDALRCPPARPGVTRHLFRPAPGPGKLADAAERAEEGSREPGQGHRIQEPPCQGELRGSV
ncbi:microtubule nucleation factor SSNA1 isoform 1-T1 [Vipera latastei]